MAQQDRDAAVRKANAHLIEIRRLTQKILAEAERRSAGATWPEIGTLGHIHEVLADLASGFGEGA